MKLKNYTSTVPVERTLARIEQVIAQAGAANISKEYNQGVLTALYFKVKHPGGREIPVRLPADPEAVYQTLRKAVRRYRPGTDARLREQARRTAWKLMQDWVEVQVSLIEMKQAEFLQVFMPYIWDGERTLFTLLRDRDFIVPQLAEHV